jgi:hypothetical protein
MAEGAVEKERRKKTAMTKDGLRSLSLSLSLSLCALPPCSDTRIHTRSQALLYPPVQWQWNFVSLF